MYKAYKVYGILNIFKEIIMIEKPITGRIFFGKNNSYHIYIGDHIALKLNFKAKEQVKIYIYPDEKKIEIVPFV
jgi:hypothetical protein